MFRSLLSRSPEFTLKKLVLVHIRAKCRTIFVSHLGCSTTVYTIPCRQQTSLPRGPIGRTCTVLLGKAEVFGAVKPLESDANLGLSVVKSEAKRVIIISLPQSGTSINIVFYRSREPRWLHSFIHLFYLPKKLSKFRRGANLTLPLQWGV